MTAERILITGAAGQLGQAVMDLFSPIFTVLGTDVNLPGGNSNLTYMDITDPASIQAVLSEFSPTCILNLAAMTDVDGCERKPDLARLINRDSVHHLRTLFSGKIVHISTDYVFDGEEGPYGENDPVNPLSVYGQTKLESEAILQDSDKPALIIRTNVVFDYTRTQASFVKWVVDSLIRKEKIRVVDDQWNNPTWTVDLAEKCSALIQWGAEGLYHYGGGDYLNRYQFACKIADHFQLDASLITRIKTSELSQLAPRPLKGGLKTDLICKKFNVTPLPLDAALESIVKRTRL